MEAAPNEIEYLSKQIILDDKPVTYHSLSRALCVHVNHAKKLLAEFYQKNPDKVKASFVITGTSDGATLIKFAASEAVLQEWTQKYTDIHTVQIYGLSKSEVSAEELALQDLKHPIDYAKVAEYVQNGMIQGPELSLDVVEQRREVVRENRPIEVKPKDVKNEEPKKEEKKKNTGLSSSYVSRKAKPERTNTLSNYTSRKEELKKRDHPQSTGYQYKSRKLANKEPKERVVIADAHDDVVEEEVHRPAKINTSELDKMFEDDFSDEDTEMTEPAQDIPPEVPEIEMEAPEIPVSEPEPMFVPEEDSPPPMQDTVDEDGFITTYRKGPPSKPADRKKTTTPTPKPKPKPKQAITKKNDGKKMQSSLMSFLQPKK